MTDYDVKLTKLIEHTQALLPNEPDRPTTTIVKSPDLALGDILRVTAMSYEDDEWSVTLVRIEPSDD
jgi:hypothetical protein